MNSIPVSLALSCVCLQVSPFSPWWLRRTASASSTAPQRASSPLAFSPRLPFAVVASDHGSSSHPVHVHELTIAPGERWEIVVDFGGLPANTKVRR